MTKYERLQNIRDEDFRRLTGVKRVTFNKMTEILNCAEAKKKSKGGRPSKLSIEDRLLAALEYIREYRTYFHIGASYGVSESVAYKIIKWVEDVLIKDGTFSLPGRKELLKSDNDIEAILIDATETPVERPKKNKGGTTQVKRKDIP